jgi:hypothetical protein
MGDRHFPPPWSVEENDARFIVKDANGQALAYVYFEKDPRRRAGALFALFAHTGAEEAHEGPSGSCLPRAVPRSGSRGVAAPQGNAHPGAQHHRPAAGALREQGASP